jgi:hypothetical protein
MSVEDAAEGDATGAPPLMDAAALAELEADPDLALPVAELTTIP